MNFVNKRIARIALAAATGFLILFAADKIASLNRDTLFATADARIGRPLTPMSYAGVARRTVRRGAYVAGAAAVAGGAAVYGSDCYQVVDAYGRIYMRCP